MLRFKHSSHFHLPFARHSTRRIALSAETSEKDELIQVIEEAHDGEQWQLSPVPDVAQLDEFWTGVEDDLKADPTWIDFSDE